MSVVRGSRSVGRNKGSRRRRGSYICPVAGHQVPDLALLREYADAHDEQQFVSVQCIEGGTWSSRHDPEEMLTDTVLERVALLRNGCARNPVIMVELCARKPLGEKNMTESSVDCALKAREVATMVVV